MRENESQSLPPFASLDELVEFFDTHDMGDYEMPEAHFDVNIKRRTQLVAIDEEIASRLGEIAKEKQIPAEALVNSWLKEKILNYSEKA
ncbi:MAG TPA: CopG family antitoxin [Pyrinomonadaceae bacterium]